MTVLAASGFIEIGQDRLEYRHLGPQPADAPTLVLLHEGLGAATLWADLPARLQHATGLGVFAFYKALAMGTMSLVAPVSALGAGVPMVFGIADGERPSGMRNAIVGR